MNDEELPYRSAVPAMNPTADRSYSKDEEQYSTLVAVEKVLAEAMENLKSFDAFDLTESEMKLKQQIKAHQLAHGIIAPLHDSVRDALSKVNSKYKQR